MKLKNICVATEKKGYYHILEESCKRNNIELITLGLGKKWTGFTMRFKLWNDYLEKLDDNEIVMINDAYDVIILEDGNTIINKFKSLNKNVIFSEQDSIITRMVFNRCDIYNKVICMGNIIGYVKYIKKIIKLLNKYKNMWDKYNNDDQAVLQNICKLEKDFFKNNVGIDTDKNIFFVTFGQDYLYNILTKNIPKLHIKNNKIYNNNYITPSVLHLAGNVDGVKYLKKLNYYNIPKYNLFDFNQYKIKQFNDSLKIGIQNNTKYFIIIICIVIYIIILKLVFDKYY